MLSKKISQISKFLLLFNILIGGVAAEVVSSDRFLLKILDRTISLHDIEFQERNIKALNCIYNDAFVIKFFEKSFMNELDTFLKGFPKTDEEIRRYLHGHGPVMKKIRHFFKMLRYSEDQKADVNPKLNKLIRESAKENKCNADVLYKDTLKTNFISLMEMELYLRARYGAQVKSSDNFETIKPSIELFVESLDKQFPHEYYW